MNKENRAPLAPVSSSVRAPLGVLKAANIQPTQTAGAAIQKPRLSTSTPSISLPLESEYQSVLSYTGPDPLSRWLQYIAQITPNATQTQLYTVLSECATRFQPVAEYQNSPKYLKLWIQLADLSASLGVEKGEKGGEKALLIFSKLRELGIGSKLAMLYQAHSFVLEQLGRIQEADKVYMEGLMAQADPLTVLIQNYNKFKARTAAIQLQEAASTPAPAAKTVQASPQVASVQPAAAPTPQNAIRAAIERKSINAVPQAKPAPAPVQPVAAPNPSDVPDYDPSLLVSESGEEQSFEEYRATVLMRRAAEAAAAAVAAAEENAAGMEFTMAHNGSIILNHSAQSPLQASAALETPTNSNHYQSHFAQPNAAAASAALKSSPSIQSFLDTKCVRTPQENTKSPALAMPSPTVFTKEALEDVDAMFKDSTSDFNDLPLAKALRRKSRASLAPSYPVSSAAPSSLAPLSSFTNSSLLDSSSTAFSNSHYQNGTFTSELSEALESKSDVHSASISSPLGVNTLDSLSISAAVTPVQFGIFQEFPESDADQDHEENRAAINDTENEDDLLMPKSKSSGFVFSIHEDTALIQERLGIHQDSELDGNAAAEPEELDIAPIKQSFQIHQSPPRKMEIPIFNDENLPPVQAAAPVQPAQKRAPLQPRAAPTPEVAASAAAPVAAVPRSDSMPTAAPVQASFNPASVNSVQPMFNLQGHLLTPILETSHESDSSSVSASMSMSSISAQSRTVAQAIARSGNNAEFEEAIDPFEFDTRQGLLCELKVLAMDGVIDRSTENAPFAVESVINGSETDIEVGERLLHVDRVITERHTATATATADAPVEENVEQSAASFAVNDIVESADFCLRVFQPADLWEYYIGATLRKRLDSHSLSLFQFPVEAHFYNNVSCSLSPLVDSISLHELGVKFDSLNQPIPDTLILFYTLEMTKILQCLHEQHVLHTNYQLQNLRLRLHDGESNSICGLKLVNFHSAIDVTLFPPGAQFYSSAVQPLAVRNQCVLAEFEPLMERPWTEQIDLFGLADNVHRLLFRSPIASRMTPNSALAVPQGSTPGRVQIAPLPYKSAWQKSTFQPLFDVLLVTLNSSTAPNSVSLLAAQVQRLEKVMEGDRAKELKMLLCKQAMMGI